MIHRIRQWLFPPPPPKPITLGPQPETDRWTEGDTAVCIRGDNWCEFTGTAIIPSSGPCPRKGDVSKVTAVCVLHGWLCITLVEFPGTWWGANSFRKIVADEQEACEPEFITLLKRVKRKVDA